MNHSSTPLLLNILAANEAALIVGPTGSGKTYAIPEIARSLNLTPDDVALVQVSAETTRYDLVGYKSSTGISIPGLLSPILKRGFGLIVLDELDKGSPNTLLVLKGIFAGRIATSEGYFDIDRSKLRLVATANTTGSGATLDYNAAVKQDAALLNEFITVRWDYDTKLEAQLVMELYKSLWPNAAHTIYRLDAEWVENEFDMFSARFNEAIASLRKTALDIGDSSIFATRQIRQCMNLMFKQNLMFSQVILATSLRDVDNTSMQTYQPLLDKADARLLKVDIKEEQRRKEAEEREHAEAAKSPKKQSNIVDHKHNPQSSAPKSGPSSHEGLSEIF